MHRSRVDARIARLIVAACLILPAASWAQATIETVAGGGTQSGSNVGDGGPATSGVLASPWGIAVDSAGNLYISDRAPSFHSSIRKVKPAGIITTIAGIGRQGFSGDGGPATSAALSEPQGVAIDSAGNIYIADFGNARVRRINTAGIISTVAGNGNSVYSGDGGPATSAALTPAGISVDAAGNLYIADSGNGRIRKVSPAGIITTVAGNGKQGFAGDGGPAISAELFSPSAVLVDGSGNLYIADTVNNRIRKVDTAGNISTVAGGKIILGSVGDGGPATSAQLLGPYALALDNTGNLYIADTGNNRIREVNTAGIISTVAGNGAGGGSGCGDGGPATSACIGGPRGVAVDGARNLYISDTDGNRVRKVPAPPSTTPLIFADGVVNGASFQPGIAPGSWATIEGRNLASGQDNWDDSIVAGKLPTKLDGVTVTVGGQAAYPYYISPGQINFLVPNVGAGPLQVTVTNSFGMSSAVTVTSRQYAPAFFTWLGSQAVATRADYTWAVKNGTFAGTATVAAKPGEVLILWGTGFGPTAPAAPEGQVVPGDQTYSTAVLPSVTIGNVPATVYGAALAPGFAGLYQVAIQVPATLGAGDWPAIANIGGLESPAGTVLSVQP